MSSAPSVLYDAPGPRARRRALIGGLVVLAVIVAAVAVAGTRLAAQGQFDGELWSPLFDPRDEVFPDVWALLGTGLRNTLVSAVLAISFALVLGTFLGTLRMLMGRWGRVPVVGFIELLRGLPVIVTIFLASRVLPDLGVNLGPLPGSDGLWYVVIGLTLYNMVIIAEILRAGVASLPRGQREAAMAVGLQPAGVMRLVLLPQAVRTMLPALISQMVVILKDSSLAGLLGIYEELLRQGRTISQNLDNPIQTYLLIGAMFILINYALSKLAELVQRRTGRAGRSMIKEDGAATPTLLVGDGRNI